MYMESEEEMILALPASCAGVRDACEDQNNNRNWHFSHLCSAPGIIIEAEILKALVRYSVYCALCGCERLSIYNSRYTKYGI